MQSFWQDFRHCSRMLLKRRGFTLTAVSTLALGIGATTAIFSVVDAVLLRPLPFSSPELLVAIGGTQTPDRSRFGTLSYPDFRDLRSQSQAFERMAAYRTRSFTMVGASGASRLRGAIAGSDLFPVLGISPLIGRTFVPAEDLPGGGRLAILSHSLWQGRFGSDPGIVGRGVELNGASYTIVGVMPPRFQFPIEGEPVELWTNFARDIEGVGTQAVGAQRGNRYLDAIGRLKQGISAGQAEAQLVSIASTLEQQYPNDNHGFSVRVTPMLEHLTGSVSRSLWLLSAAVGFLLLIACANVAGLLLTRGLNRRREIAVRTALGASHWRVIRLLVTESILLAGVGGVAGVALASFGMDALIAMTPEDIPRIAEASLDRRVLFFTLAITVLTGIVTGLVPAWQCSRFGLAEELKEGGRTLADRRAAVRNSLVVAQVAVAVVLLVGAGLLIRSFAQLLRVAPGFDAEQLLTIRIGLPDGLYSRAEDVGPFHQQLMTSLDAVPGVSAHSIVHPLPMTGGIKVGFGIEGGPKQSGRDYPYETRLFLVGADYFRTLRIALRQGRDFGARDNLYSTQVVIINESFARTFFPDRNPLGQRINPAMSADDRPLPMREIIGVVADARSKTLTETPEPEVYLHIPQCPASSSFTLLLRTANDPDSLTGFVRETVAKLDRNVPIYQVRSFESYIAATLTQPRFNSFLVSTFAAVALLLTAIGLYGVIAFSVSQRTREIGLRLALGARGRDVFKLIVGHGLKLAFVGVVLGVAGALALTRTIKGLLFGVTPTDPLTFIAIVLLLAFVALLACWVPARRAAKIDPMIALRSE